MKNYEEITGSLLERRDRYVAEQKEKRRTILGAAASLCCLCLIVLMSFLIGQGGQPDIQPEQTLGDALHTGIQDYFEDTVTPDDPATNHKITVHRTESAPFQIMDVALMLDDFVEMTREEMEEYYGVDYVPDVPADLIAGEQHIGIYKRSGGVGEIYCDRNALHYANADGSRGVTLNVAKGRVPLTWGMPSLTELEKSVIHNHEVTIFQTEDGSYFAEFMHGDAGFVLFAHGVSQEELVAIVASVVG